MKVFKKHTIVLFSLAALVMAVCFPPALQAAGESRPVIETDLETMRAQIQANGWTFNVGDNSMLYQGLDRLSHPGTDPACSPTVSTASAVSNDAAKLPFRFSCVNVPIKNGGTGNGWLWASTGTFERTIKYVSGVTASLSEIWLLECNPYGWDATNGWFASDIFFRDGAVLSSNFTSGSSCVGVPISYQANGWSFCGNGYGVASTDSIKTAILNYGAVAAMVYVDSYFIAYSGGVFNAASTGNVNYFVVICGWDDANNAWVITPSWGTNWGENGYMRIAYGCHNIGWAANYLIY
jgi:hypothetical protein